MSTPIKFKELTLRNFMSYGNNVTTINLEFNEPTLVIGHNLDAVVNGQIDSNGAGKSAILDALSFVLYDRTISGIDKADLINNVNKKNLEVSLLFEKNGLLYKIIRSRKSKTKGDVKFLVEDKEGVLQDKTPDSVANTNKEIERIVGVPFEVFSRIIVFSATFEPFLKLPSRHVSKANQTGIMEELFGYTELTDKAETLKEKIKGVRVEFTHLEDLQRQIVLEMERHTKQIELTEHRIRDWDKTQQSKISLHKQSLEELSLVDFDSERAALEQINDINGDITTFTSDIRVLTTELLNLRKQKADAEDRKNKIEVLRKKVKTIEEKIDFEKETAAIEQVAAVKYDIAEATISCEALKDLIKAITTEETKIDEEMEHLQDNKCPYCKQTFEDANTKLKDLTTHKKDLTKKGKGHAKELKAENLILSGLEEDLVEANAALVWTGTLQELNNIKADYERYKTQIAAYTEDDDNVDDTVEAKTATLEAKTASMKKLQDQLDAISRDRKYTTTGELERAAANKDGLVANIETMSTETNPHIDTLADLNVITFDNDKSEQLNKLDSTLTHQEFLLKLLTRKDSFVRKNLLDKSLPFLNSRLMIYLKRLGLPHRVEFQGDMSASISQFGTGLSFSGLSSGQAARVNLALAFAFRDVLQARHGKISFCMLDECLDTGLGNVGVQLAAQMIKEIATEGDMSMLIISHRDEIASMFDNKMVVELKGGFSNIIKT